MNINTIAIGCDHAGFPYKNPIVKFLEEQGIHILDFGTNSTNSVDYPDFVHPVANSIKSSQADLGIVICGSGNGVAMTANKHQGIRAAICWTIEISTLSRQHNNANIIAIPARFVSQELAINMIDTFVKTSFEGGRHARRVGKISCV